jgi:hypothetical protein
MDSIGGVRRPDPLAAIGRGKKAGRKGGIVVRYLSATTLCAALLLLSLPIRLAAQAEGLAQVIVEVTNATAGGATVVGDEVTLQVYRHEQPVQMLGAKVGEDGKAAFEAVTSGPHLQAVARVKHQSMSFRSRSVALSAEGSPFSVPVTVYDVSTDTSTLSVGTHHIMIGVRDSSLQLSEYIQLRNPSDKAVTSADRDTGNRPVVVAFKLPEGFRDLAPSSYLEPGSLVITPEGFYDTLAVPPGEHHISFSYRVPIDHDTVSLTREVSLPTSELAIFWEQGQGTLEGLGDPESRLVNNENVPVEYYRRTDLKPGDKITFRISGFNMATPDSHTWIVLVVAFVFVGVIVLWRLRSRPVLAEFRE